MMCASVRQVNQTSCVCPGSNNTRQVFLRHNNTLVCIFFFMSTTTLPPPALVEQTSNQQGTESQQPTPTTPPAENAPVQNGTDTPQPLASKPSVKDYKMKKRIGGGGEGAVYLASNLKQQSSEDVAIKCIICHAEEDAKTTRKEVYCTKKNLIFLVGLFALFGSSKYCKAYNVLGRETLFFSRRRNTFLSSDGILRRW